MASTNFRAQGELSSSVMASAGQLFDLDRPGWAWEWLRRNPDFMSLDLIDERSVKAGHSLVARPTLATEQSLMRWGLHYA